MICSIISDICMIPLVIITFVLYILGFYPIIIHVVHFIRKIFSTKYLTNENDVVTILLHGSGYNESEWLLGQLILPNVYTFNYAHLFGNDATHDIRDYAEGIVAQKIKAICNTCKINKVNIIGHSMGGLIGAHYAEFVASKDNIHVSRIVTIGTPWQGTPVINKLPLSISSAKRYQDMMHQSKFLQLLIPAVESSINSRLRQYFCIGSPNDLMVPNKSWYIDNTHVTHMAFPYNGHYSLIANYKVWQSICIFLR